jgi:hypothetical protein
MHGARGSFQSETRRGEGDSRVSNGAPDSGTSAAIGSNLALGHARSVRGTPCHRSGAILRATIAGRQAKRIRADDPRVVRRATTSTASRLSSRSRETVRARRPDRPARAHTATATTVNDSWTRAWPFAEAISSGKRECDTRPSCSGEAEAVRRNGTWQRRCRRTGGCAASPANPRPTSEISTCSPVCLGCEFSTSNRSLRVRDPTTARLQPKCPGGHVQVLARRHVGRP